MDCFVALLLAMTSNAKHGFAISRRDAPELWQKPFAQR
jgi:hypothetical protein